MNEKAGKHIYHISLKDLFDQFFGEQEYPIFMDYVQKFNEQARCVIGFSTVLSPTEEAISKFKAEKTKMLYEYPYKDILY